MLGSQLGPRKAKIRYQSRQHLASPSGRQSELVLEASQRSEPQQEGPPGSSGGWRWGLQEGTRDRPWVPDPCIFSRMWADKKPGFPL